MLSPLARLSETGAKVCVLVHLPPCCHHVVGVVHGGSVVGSDGWPCSVASPVGSDDSGWQSQGVVQGVGPPSRYWDSGGLRLVQ